MKHLTSKVETYKAVDSRRSVREVVVEVVEIEGEAALVVLAPGLERVEGIVETGIAARGDQLLV